MACLVCVAMPVGSAAQANAIVIEGAISDTSGGVVPGATIEAVINGRVLTVTTSGPDGSYRLGMPAGAVYFLRVSLDGFATEITRPAVAEADAVVDMELRVGAISDTVVVTASGTERSLANIAESVSVFTAADLDTLGAASVADVLQTVPGLSIEATGREGGLASLFSRGAESDYNLVLIDGVRVNISGGRFDFSRIGAGEIERVEVVRGAQSALYGSGAIGSVIQIFTRRGQAADPPRLLGSVEGGTFKTMRGDLTLVGGAGGRMAYRVGVAARGTDGAFADLLPEHDRFDQTAFNLGLDSALNDRVSLRTTLRYASARGRAVGPINYGSRDTGTVYNSRDISWNLESTHLLSPTVTGTVRFGYFRYDSDQDDTIADPPYHLYAILEGTPGALFPDSPRLVRFIQEPEFDAIAAGTQALQAEQILATTPFGVTDFPFTFHTEFRRPTLDYTVAWTWQPGQVLTAGYAYEHQSNPLGAGFQIANHAYFAQQQLTLADDWFVSLGARVDDNAPFGTTTSPKLSVGGYPVPFADGPLSSVKVFASRGRGIKNPRLGELFGDDFTDGNPNLAPEAAVTADAGVELTVDSQRVRIAMTYFDSQYEDQVAFSPTGFTPDGLPDFINVNGSEASGWEFEAALQRPVVGITAAGTYSYVDTQVTATRSTSQQFQPGQPLLRRPTHSGTFRVGYQRGPARLSLNVRAVGQRHDSGFLFLTSVPTAAFAQAVPVDTTVNAGYTVVGLGAEIDAHDAVSLFFRVDNLTDEAYERALGYPGTPRSVVLGTRFQLGR